MLSLHWRITDAEYDRFYQSFREQIANIDTRLGMLQEAEDNYYITAKYLLELANRAYDLFVSSATQSRTGYNHYMKWVLGIFLIMAVGIFLRTYNINAKEFWYDEAFTSRMVKNNFTQIIDLSSKDAHPPLYYLTTKAWTNVFGTSDFGIRSLSVLFGVLLIPVTYYLVNLLSDNKIGALLVSTMIAVNPFFVTYSKEGRSYSMFAFVFVLLVTVVFWLRKKDKGWKRWLALSILLSAFFLTHYVSVFSIPVLVWLLPRNKKMLIALLPLILFVYLQLPAMLAPRKPLEWIPPVTSERITRSIQAFVFGVYNDNLAVSPPNVKIPYLHIVLLVLIIWYILDHDKNHYELLILGLVPIVLVALAGIFGKNLYIERYLIPYGYALIVYIGVVIVSFPRKYAVPVLVCYFILSVYLTLHYVPVNVGYKSIAKYMDSLDKVIMVDATEYIAISRYSDKVKLQNGDWSEWVIINDTDILVKENSKPFYLANRGELKERDYTLSKDGVFFYRWQ